MTVQLTSPICPPSHAADDSSADAQLARVLEDYLAAMEAGQAPSAAELIAAHPHLAERLAGCLASLQFLEQAGDDVRACAPAPEFPGHDAASARVPGNRGALGDFQLVREIGRGGMGVVYEAEQISLARRVAVKVLPFAAMLDERQLARFKNEARAAASLHHPHIVPVFYVGADRGVHYYAMQYIEGTSLAEVLVPPPSQGGARGGIPDEPSASSTSSVRAGSSMSDPWDSPPAPSPRRGGLGRGDAAATRDATTPPLTPPHPGEGNGSDTKVFAALPTLPDRSSRAHFRCIAELGIQAAEALHHAHESGVVHRDVKPSNLLLGARGHLWVADFGLARTGADPALTMTGDLVGTLRYMSPEQLRGKVTTVDHRTDVYSLGVTLYELLTLRTAFPQEEAEELMRGIAHDNPPAPRAIHKQIPPDLETIVMKAMRKDADDRYATAKDLADDLERFLAAKAILAKPPTTRDRVLKWSRRHASFVVAWAAALSAAAIVCVIAAALTLQAYRAETRQRERAEDHLMLAADSIDRLLSRTAGDRRAAGDMKQAEALAVDATEFYERLLERGDQDDLIFRAAAAYEQVAVIWMYIEQYEKAGAARRRSKELLAPLAVSSQRSEHQAAMATNYVGQSQVALIARDHQTARSSLESALAIYQNLARTDPGNPDFDLGVAQALADLGMAAWLGGQLDEAEAFYARAAAVEAALPASVTASPDYWERRGAVLNNWAMLVRDRGEHDRALRMFRESVAWQRRALKASGRPPADIACYRLATWNIAATYGAAGDYDAALQAVDELLTACPDHLDAYQNSAVLLVACALECAGDEADKLRARARRCLAEGRAAAQQSLDAQEGLAMFHAVVNDAEFRDPAEARRLAERVLAEAPQRGGAWHALAWAHYRAADWSAAETALENAVRHAPARRATSDHWLLRAMIRWQQGDAHQANEWLAKAQDSRRADHWERQLFDALRDEANDLIKPDSEAPQAAHQTSTTIPTESTP